MRYGNVFTHRIRCLAIALVMPHGAAIGGASAAHLHGVDVLDVDAPVEVAVPPGLRMPRHDDVVARYSELHGGDVAVVAGVRATNSTRTAFDLARWRATDEAVVAVDALLHAGGVTLDGIARYAADGRACWHGVQQIGEVLSLAAPGAESPMETRLRLALVGAGLPAPTLQHRVWDGTGALLARIDMAYVESRLGIEYDGACHWAPTAIRRDLRRQNSLHALGWTILRFTADDVLHNRPRLLAQVRTALARTARTA